MVRIASFNVENLFERPKAFDTSDWELGKPALAAYSKVNDLFGTETYSHAGKQEIVDQLLTLEIYTRNGHGAIRRNEARAPNWAWLRKNRGQFDRQPADDTKDVEIIAGGRADWIGWVELAKEQTDEVGTRMTAKVIGEIDADIIGIVEAEDRPSLVRLNKDLLGEQYRHVMLVDGNDDRGIDVGLMAGEGFEIASIRSHVDDEDDQGEHIFSRDCPEYEVRLPSGASIHVLVNHFKSQSGGGGPKRQRQAEEVRQIVNRLVAENKHVVVLGDFNEGPTSLGGQAVNLGRLYDSSSPLAECYSLPQFSVGSRPGTFDSCGIRNRLDYIFVSQSLAPLVHGGEVFRKGLWGTRKTRPTDWATYPEMTSSSVQASDHAAVYVDIDI